MGPTAWDPCVDPLPDLSDTALWSRLLPLAYLRDGDKIGAGQPRGERTSMARQMWYNASDDQVRDAGLLFSEAYTPSQPHIVVGKAPVMSDSLRAGLVVSVGNRCGGGFVMEKKCGKCGQVKPLEQFHKNSTRRDGFAELCRDCKKISDHASYVAHAEKRAESARTYRLANAEKVAERKRAYYLANIEKVTEYHHNYYQANAERKNEQTRVYRQVNKEHVDARKAAYRAGHREGLAADARAYYRDHAEHVRQRQRSYHRAHPEKASEGEYQRRIRKREGFIESVSRAEVYARDEGRCHICKRKVNPKHWQLDHLIPLSLGGEHSYKNVAVAHPKCNRRRYNTGPAQLRLIG